MERRPAAWAPSTTRLSPGDPLSIPDAVSFASPRSPSSKEYALQPLSPREIQARVRAGASPEIVAAETGWPLDKVLRYAEPPLGERAYVAQQARAVEISRSRGGSTLQESTCSRLGVEPDEVSWDAYRADDGRWIVTAVVAGRGVGAWSYEAVGRSVHPLDESARALMGGGPSAVLEAEPVPDQPTSTEASPAPPTPTPSPTPPAPPESSTPEDVEPVRPRLVSVTSDPTASEAPREADSDSDPEALIPQEEISSPRRAKRTKGKKGRASVPSWDEILFGASRPED